MTFRTVHGDFLKAKEAFPNDKYLSTMGDTLQLSKEALYYDPNILASQIMGRRPKKVWSELFVSKYNLFPEMYEVPYLYLYKI